jgi:hypothetical protein
MKITIEHFSGKYPQFNVNLASGEGRQPFLTIKGCRIVEGSKGRFVSWPATKNESTGKYWQHCYANESFSAAVMAEAEATLPKPASRKTAAESDEDIPF